MGQDLLWVTQPQRKTCLAKVIAVRGPWFQVDTALFAPRSTAWAHPQNHDKGTVWLSGEKRKLSAIKQHRGVWYQLRGTVPPVGQELQCQLDQDTRQQASLAHTAMHLWLDGSPEVPVVAQEVRGGGHFRVEYAWPVAPKDLQQTLEWVRQRIAHDQLVTQEFVTKDAATYLGIQTEEPLVPVVMIGESVHACDGAHVDRTGRISSVQVVHAKQGRGGFVVSVKVS